MYCAKYHLVFATKYRRKVLKQGLGAYLLKILHNITKKFPDVEILESNTDKDHVHLLLSIPPKYSISEIVQYLKGRSAHDMRKKFPFLNKAYYGTDGIWSEGYFVSTVGINEEIIQRYIEHQGKEDSGQVSLVF
mgnify:FL=1